MIICSKWYEWWIGVFLLWRHLTATTGVGAPAPIFSGRNGDDWRERRKWALPGSSGLPFSQSRKVRLSCSIVLGLPVTNTSSDWQRQSSLKISFFLDNLYIFYSIYWRCLTCRIHILLDKIWSLPSCELCNFICNTFSKCPLFTAFVLPM